MSQWIILWLDRHRPESSATGVISWYLFSLWFTFYNREISFHSKKCRYQIHHQSFHKLISLPRPMSNIYIWCGHRHHQYKPHHRDLSPPPPPPRYLGSCSPLGTIIPSMLLSFWNLLSFILDQFLYCLWDIIVGMFLLLGQRQPHQVIPWPKRFCVRVYDVRCSEWLQWPLTMYLVAENNNVRDASCPHHMGMLSWMSFYKCQMCWMDWVLSPKNQEHDSAPCGWMEWLPSTTDTA